ncbi:MAG: translation initiation factor IF-2 [Parachlamydiales bacterium]|nr:translation initiation factor IF-2 [Parachlamydiales bacterium]
MAKDIKLNIKNAQIAEALKKFSKKPAAVKKTTRTKKEKEVEIDEEPKKRKARIAPAKKPPIEEAEKPKAKVRVKKEEVETPKAEEIKEQTTAKEKKPKIAEKTEEIKEETQPTKIEKKEFLEEEEEEVETPKKIEIEQPIKPKEIEKPKALIKEDEEITSKKAFKTPKDFKAAKKPETFKSFDSQARQGLRSFDEERWRKKRVAKHKKKAQEIPVIRPSHLKVRIPISIKDLASYMKLKASELIQKLFMQGVVVTINDYLEDETTIQLLGHEFNCQIDIDVAEEKRLQITEMSIKEEIHDSDEKNLSSRPPIITFMGHVDHGKTSLIDAIRSSNIAAAEAGQITQHIGAFNVKTKFGAITILDTPGHEAFSEMRSRGANVTDIVILVVAGDEGIKDQTLEAISKAKEANVPIVVAINKCDKVGFDAEKIYRQLADHDLLPEPWGGTTICVKCSAQTKEGIDTLLEMISLQSEIIELKANKNTRARGSILESQMHKGLGAVATVLILNGTLKANDSIVFSDKWGRVKTIHDQYNNLISEAGPSIPVKITGLSDLAEAGSEFIVVANEKEAKELAEARREKMKTQALQKAKIFSLESLGKKEKKIFHVMIRADVQGSLEALKQSLLKIKSTKVDLNIVSAEVGEISESDIRLAYASKAVILGFHTKIESHAEPIIKQLKVIIKQHDIIYHVIDEVRELMRSILDKVPEEHDTGAAKVIALFKASQLGLIAGCIVTDGTIKRNSLIRIIRNGEVVKKTKVNSLKRVKEDVKEVKSGVECGILLADYTDVQKDDIIQAYDITYLEQEL